MKIFEYCPFFNEHKIASLKIKEADYWIDELHICEADKNFSYEDKPFQFDPAQVGAKVKYHPIHAGDLFRPALPEQSYYHPDRCTPAQFDQWYWHLLTHNMGYHNEAMQRNYCGVLKDVVGDEDIIILSDLDEFIDSRLADKIIDEVKRHQVITVKLHFSVFYLNLFSDKSHGIDDFSYRTYLMTGKYFRKMPFTGDYLRKKGISGGLQQTVHCTEGFMGFHHSWLQHSTNAFTKLKAFEANVQDKSLIRSDFAEQCIKDRRLPYIDANLYVDNEKPFLRSVLESETSGLWFEGTL
ncbi:hypothetical protein KTO58_08110 [Chitinophaga pendula]|uniref:hypothetical protein n=1 Tax=Chitinophaga TaxID=79328 RepID=UPI000BB0222A|nr:MULTISPECIES: hypothetical protein [Chitinophaga]ASZ13245.1 hypothetical protein CK934_20900 [Chitinophaga sp. MD30]UCJ09135.1 hypothetical protein KTO58_08110 [Chitinophaga pendula]